MAGRPPILAIADAADCQRAATKQTLTARTGPLWRETCKAVLYASQIRLSATANGTTNVSKELYLNALNPQIALSYQST